MARRRVWPAKARPATVHGVNVTPARVVPLQLAAQQDAPRDLLGHLAASVGVVGDAATDLSNALAVRLVSRGRVRRRDGSFAAGWAPVSES
jgi:hypothetical protein